MFTAKFRIKHDNCWIVPKTIKYSITTVGLPLTSYTKNGKKYHTGVSFIKGTEENKQKFLRNLKKDKGVKQFSLKGDQLFVLIEGSNFITHMLDRELFFTAPVVSKEGFEYWELASWNREKLVTFFQRAKKIAEVEMLKLKEETPSLTFYQTVPSLTKKQQDAWHIATQYGYYHYPRKISVQALAQKVKTPRSTFQEHLRKAEAKIMPVLEFS